MTTRCNRVGVRIYVDAVINHMAAHQSGIEIGTGDSTFTSNNKSFPAVPYTSNDFHSDCSISDYNDKGNVRYCQLVGLADLDQGSKYVQDKIVDYMNKLIDLGVAGFRIDGAKHMEPKDLQEIFSRLNSLNISHGFKPFMKPFIYTEVIGTGGAIEANEYDFLGAVTEFKFSIEMGKAFRGKNALKWLKNFGTEWNLLPSNIALTFVDNHDDQRSAADSVLTYKDARMYKMATGFHLAWPYGIPQMMSSYDFNDYNKGPPMDKNEEIISPSIQGDGSCGNGYVCEHRWRQIANMNLFRNAVRDTKVENWWDNGNNQIAFSRGKIGFIAFNGEYNTSMNVTLQTGLPAGVYCDIISGKLCETTCTGGFVTVSSDGMANIYNAGDAVDGFVAIYKDSKVPEL
jgi:alpha-amylase